MVTQDFVDWLATPHGRYVLDWEQGKHDQLVADIFGFNAIQIGSVAPDYLCANRMPLRVRCATSAVCTPPYQLCVDPHALPFAANSIDLMVLPHVLEFGDNPHQILREVERVLVPEGSVIVTGFNPYNFWSAKRRLIQRNRLPAWHGRYISLSRLKDWFALLGLEAHAGAFGCYAPLLGQEKWLRRLRWLDAAGDRWWPIGGAVYIIQAIKRVPGMRVLTPKWKDRLARAKALKPVTRKTDPR